MVSTSPTQSNASEPGWRQKRSMPSLPEVFSSVHVPAGGTFWRKLLAFVGPGLMVSVGYMDPGNWATDLAGGSKFGYTLLAVILLSNLMAILLQALAARLGIVTDRDLAQACRASFSRPVNFMLWVVCEAAIIACDLAEVIGTAIALNLLFGIPLIWGALITALDAFLVLYLMNRGFRALEAFIVALLLIIFVCFAIQIAAASPPVAAVMGGLLPSREIVTNPAMLYIAMGIIGATVMPHNLYLHSALVQSRKIAPTNEGIKRAIKFNTIDSAIALNLALFTNAAILILAAAVFHKNGYDGVSEIQDAHQLLAPLLGANYAPALFAIALIAAGQSSTVTGTLAGQIVMEGFTELRIPRWARQSAARLIAMVPAVATIAIWGEESTTGLLILSQVVLSLQLPFAVYPLVRLTGDRRWMGSFANRRLTATLAWTLTVILIGINLYLPVALALQ